MRTDLSTTAHYQNKGRYIHCTPTANHLLARHVTAIQDLLNGQWQPSTQLIRDVKNNQCHQRYVDQESECEEGNVKIASDWFSGGDDDENELAHFMI